MTASHQQPPPLLEAAKFVYALLGVDIRTTPIVLQTLDDDEERRRAGRGRKGLTRVLRGTLPNLWPQVVALNQQGAGIFLQINAGGRGVKNVTALRALFIDDDGGRKVRQEDGTYALQPTPPPNPKLPCSAIIERGGNNRKRHYYWFLKEGEPLERFSEAQRHLAAYYQTDKSVKNLDRVMRLPGTIHLKDPQHPQEVKIVLLDRKHRYTIDEILAAHPLDTPLGVDADAATEAPKDISTAARTTATKLKAWLDRRRVAYRPLGGGLEFRLERCPINPDHKDAYICSVNPSGAIFAACFHNSCGANEQRWWQFKEAIGGWDAADVERIANVSGPPLRPQILITTDEPAIIDAALSALGHSPSIYRRGGMLVHVVDDHATVEQQPEIERPPGAPRIVQLPSARLREEMSRVAAWRRKKHDEVVSTHPPAWAVASVQARGEWPTLRPLLTVTEAPTLRPDGSVITEPGYDKATGILYRPTIEFPRLEARPSRDRCVAAIRALHDVVSDFPFEAAYHRSAWIAGLLSVVGRFAFHGPVPLFLHDANVPGAGKSLLVDVVSLIATGRPAARMSPDDDDTEMRKRITSVALSGERLVLMDNLTGALGGAALDAALTGEEWQDRVLGTNTTIRLPLITIWFASGNNVALKGDTSRRVTHVRLRSPQEAPEERRDLRIADLRGYVRRRRPVLLVEALTILSGYCAAGCPLIDLPPWGSYEEWSRLVRSALVWAGETDPATGRQELRHAADAEAGALHAVIAGWAELVAVLGGPCTARAALDAMAMSPSDGYAELRAALAELARVPVDRLTPHNVGNVLRRARDRVVGGRALAEARTDRNGVILWTVVP